MTKFLSLPQRELESGFHSKQQGCQGSVKRIVQPRITSVCWWVGLAGGALQTYPCIRDKQEISLAKNAKCDYYYQTIIVYFVYGCNLLQIAHKITMP